MGQRRKMLGAQSQHFLEIFGGNAQEKGGVSRVDQSL